VFPLSNAKTNWYKVDETRRPVVLLIVVFLICQLEPAMSQAFLIINSKKSSLLTHFFFEVQKQAMGKENNE
jgi:hypothetical protein